MLTLDQKVELARWIAFPLGLDEDKVLLSFQDASPYNVLVFPLAEFQELHRNSDERVFRLLRCLPPHPLVESLRPIEEHLLIYFFDPQPGEISDD